MSEVELVQAVSLRDPRPSDRTCGACGLALPRGYSPDPCIGGYLPGVSHACCGHGHRRAYVMLGGEPDQCAWSIPDKRTLEGEAATAYIEAHRHEVVPA